VKPNTKTNITVLIRNCMIFHLLENVLANNILLTNEFLMHFGGYFFVLTMDTLGKLIYRAISFVSSTNTSIQLYHFSKIGFCCCCLFYAA